MRFINDDKSLKNGGRKAPAISQDELSKHILEFAGKQDDLYELEDGDVGLAAMAILTCDAVEKDLKIANFPENFEADPMTQVLQTDTGTALIGLQTLETGLTFYGISAGADWALPFFYALYWDGKKIRVYIPSRGNIINLDTKTAIGAESENDGDIEAIMAKYKKLGLTGNDPAELYLAKYGLDYSTIGYNWDAIKEDIAARITVTK